LSTWATLYNDILRSTNRPPGDADKAKGAIVDAIVKHRSEAFSCQDKDWSFPTIAGTPGYGESTSGFPVGLVEIIGEVSLEIGQSADSVVILPRVTWAQMQALRSIHGTLQGQPYAYSYWNGKIELDPFPDTVHNVKGQAKVAPFEVLRRWDTASSSFKWYKPLTTSFVIGSELTDDYPTGGDLNPYLTDPALYAMIRAYAEYLLYVHVLHAQDDRPDRALQRYLEAYGVVNEQTVRREVPRFVEPFQF
jgi:hypothetical protein